MSAAPDRNYRPYLKVYVIWHPGLDRTSAAGKAHSGKVLAERLYRHFCRDPEKPVSTALGIPFHLLTSQNKGQTPGPLDLQSALHSVVVFLVNPSMSLDDSWKAFVDDAMRQASPTSGHLVLPVFLSGTGGDLGLAALQGIRIIAKESQPEVPEEEDSRDIELRLGLATALCRLLLNQDRTLDAGHTKDEPPRLFLSHAKRDGEPAALEIKKLIEDSPLDTFFDGADIPPGYDWKEDIKQNVIQSAVIAWQTDEYASRPWCNIELLTAKEQRRPILGVVGLKAGEERSFPYAGNVRTMVSTGSNSMAIIAAAVREYLRKLYTEAHFKSLEQSHLIPTVPVHLFRPPEPIDGVLVTANKNQAAAQSLTVLYPDPPLSTAESDTMSKLFPTVTFTTPTTLSRATFRGLIVGLSLSSPDGLLPSLLPLTDAVIEIARHLLARGTALAYGGDLRPSEQGGYTQQLFDMVRAYYDTGREPLDRIHNFLASHIAAELHEVQEEKLQAVARLHKVPAPTGLLERFGLTAESAVPDDNADHRYVRSRCLTAMRKAMNDAISARVFLGGKSSGMSGKYPGILEEAYFALVSKKPIFMIGGFGGCTKLLIDALRDKRQPVQLTRDFQVQNSRQGTDKSQVPYEELEMSYRRYASEAVGEPPPDFPTVVKLFNDASIGDLRNGLADHENKDLFETTDLSRIVYLLMKGLSSIKKPD